MQKCPYCGSTKLVRDTVTFYLICSECGTVIAGTNITSDAYVNYSVRQHERQRAQEEKQRLKPKTIKTPAGAKKLSDMHGITWHRKEERRNRIYREKLIEELRRRGLWELVQVVKQIKPVSHKHIVVSFLRASYPRLAFGEALDIANNVSSKLGLKTYSFSPSDVLRQQDLERRKAARRERLEKEYRRIEHRHGREIAEAVRVLSRLPPFQPERPLDTAEALLALIAGRSAKTKPVKRRLKILQQLSSMNVHLVAQLVGREVAEMICGARLYNRRPNLIYSLLAADHTRVFDVKNDVDKLFYPEVLFNTYANYAKEVGKASKFYSLEVKSKDEWLRRKTAYQLARSYAGPLPVLEKKLRIPEVRGVQLSPLRALASSLKRRQEPSGRRQAPYLCSSRQ